MMIPAGGAVIWGGVLQSAFTGIPAQVGGPSVWFAALLGALATGLGRIITFIPALLGAIVILLIGWGIGKLVQLLITDGLRAVRLDRLTEHAGINDTLKRADIKRSPAAILGIVAYWFVFLIAIQAAVSVLGIPALTNLMTAVVLYLPRIFGALLVLIFGAWGASVLGRLTRASGNAARIPYADMLGTVVVGTTMFFVFAIALDVLGLTFPFLTTAFAIVIGTLGLAVAVAFGLGGREYASDVLAGRELRSMYNPGDRVTMTDMEGTVQEIRPTFTIVRTSRGDVAVQNTELMHKQVTKPSTPPSMGGGLSQAA